MEPFPAVQETLTEVRMELQSIDFPVMNPAPVVSIDPPELDARELDAPELCLDDLPEIELGTLDFVQCAEMGNRISTENGTAAGQTAQKRRR